MTLDLSSHQYMPYMKPSNNLRYININSNHPPIVLKNIPEGINKRLSRILSNEEVFNKAAPDYQKALDENGYKYKLHYEELKEENNSRRRQRNVIWYNRLFI